MKVNKFSISFIILFFILFLPEISFASNGEENMLDRISLLIIQISLILFAAWCGNKLFSKMSLPPVLGEILAGVIIGPYFLGQISFFGFPGGLFPLGQNFPVSDELYTLATIASIILLFLVGLETDVSKLIKYSVAGSVIGLFGVIVSFVTGDFLGVLISKPLFGTECGFFSPNCLFLGVISVATSVGITARVLSERKKMDSPEGVTILAAAVIDDVLGIIILAIVLGMTKTGVVGFKEISLISLKAFGIWLFFTFIGLAFSNQISNFLKKFKDKTTIAVMSFSLALLLAGIFERSGLAMIIGAYIMGLSLSKTDLAFIIQEKIEILHTFFVPIFFCVMGMLVNVREITSAQVLIFGSLYTLFAILGKLIGCGIPALFLNFNLNGALRIGVGMVPRGEVALIIVGIGLAAGLIQSTVFSIAVLMTFITTLITPLFLDRMLKTNKRVLVKESKSDEKKHSVVFQTPNQETSELILNNAIMAFEKEGFFVNRTYGEDKIFQIRKDNVFIVLKHSDEKIIFNCMEKDIVFIHTLFYEVLAELEFVMKDLKSLTDKAAIGKIISLSEKELEEKKDVFNIPSYLATSIDLKGKTKTDILAELVNLLIVSNQLKDEFRKKVIEELIEREEIVSTGMENGIALPHVKTDSVDRVVMAIGLSKKGIDYTSLDGKLSNIFVLILASKQNPYAYLQSMAEVNRFLSVEENRGKILKCGTRTQLYDLLTSK